MNMAILRVIHWEMLLLNDIELREAIMMADEIVRFIGDLGYVILVADQMARFLANSGRFHWKGYLMQIVDLRVHLVGRELFQVHRK